jgi:hypothetical protein
MWTNCAARFVSRVVRGLESILFHRERGCSRDVEVPAVGAPLVTINCRIIEIAQFVAPSTTASVESATASIHGAG